MQIHPCVWSNLWTYKQIQCANHCRGVSTYILLLNLLLTCNTLSYAEHTDPVACAGILYAPHFPHERASEQEGSQRLANAHVEYARCCHSPKAVRRCRIYLGPGAFSLANLMKQQQPSSRREFHIIQDDYNSLLEPRHASLYHCPLKVAHTIVCSCHEEIRCMSCVHWPLLANL